MTLTRKSLALSENPSGLKALCLQGLREHADDPAFQEKWREVKQIAKAKAVERIAHITGEEIPSHALLDIQVGGVTWIWYPPQEA